MCEDKSSYSHKMWTEVSSSVPHLQNKGLLVSPMKRRYLLRVLYPVRRKTKTTLYSVLVKEASCTAFGATAVSDEALINVQYIVNKDKGKVIPLQARCGPEGGQRYSSILP